MTLHFTKHKSRTTGDYYDAVTVDETNAIEAMAWLAGTDKAHSLSIHPMNGYVRILGFWTGRTEGHHIRVATPIQLTSDGEFVAADPVQFDDAGITVFFNQQEEVLYRMEVNLQAWREFTTFPLDMNTPGEMLHQYANRHDITPVEEESFAKFTETPDELKLTSVRHPDDN